MAAALLALAASAAAQEFCVTCSGPEASYRCLIGGDASADGRSSRGQFLCITELAKAGGHASCSATRGQVTPCPGETRTVMFSLADPGASPAGAALPPPATPLFVPVPSSNSLPPVAVPPPPPEQQAQPAQAAPPHDTGTTSPAAAPSKQTAIEAFANKTGKAVNDTGKAVGNAVKKSWDCVASLFGNC